MASQAPPHDKALDWISSPTQVIGLEHTWIWHQHNFHSTLLQRESCPSLHISNGYRLNTTGTTPGGRHLRLAPLGLTTNKTLNLIWGRTWIHSPLAGILPQFGCTSAGILRWDWRRGRTQIYPPSEMITPLVGRKGAGRIQSPETQLTGPSSFLLHQKRDPPLLPEGGIPGENQSGVPSHSD